MSHPGHALLEVPATLAAALAALVYARGWARIRRSFPSAMSTRRLAAFMVGLSSVWVAIGSPLAAFHHALLSVHMVQHVLLMAVAPPLMLIGAPALPLQYGLPWRSARGAVQRLLRSPPARSLRRFLTRPVVCWLAPVAALIGWHVPAVFELGVRSRWWHDLQAASFFATGVLFWLPVVRWRAGVVSASPWLIPVYLFAATLPCDALSAFLVFCDRVVYPSYLSAPRLSSLAPLHDQEFAGALMWVSVTLIYLLPAVVITIELLSPPRTDSIGAARHRAAVERSARKLTDRHAAAGVGVDWASGTLTYQGKHYPVSVKGLSVGDVGVTSIEASGKVFDLKRLGDFNGNYTPVDAELTAGGGGGVAAMRNQNGVTVELVSTTQGVAIGLGGAGVDMKIKK